MNLEEKRNLLEFFSIFFFWRNLNKKVENLLLCCPFPPLLQCIVPTHTVRPPEFTHCPELLSTSDMNIWAFFIRAVKGVAELSGPVVFCPSPNSVRRGVWMREVEVAGVDEGEACITMPNQPFSPGSRLSVWVRSAPCHLGLAHWSGQCPCQSRQHFLPPLAPALAGIHNISLLPTMACLPAPTIWLLWATILTHITNYSRSEMMEREEEVRAIGQFPSSFL